MTADSVRDSGVSATPVVSPRRRGLFVTGVLILVGLMPGMGIPGGLMLGLADRFFIAATGATALRAIGETAWPLAMIITVLLPLPLVPLLNWVATWRSAGVGMRLGAVLFALLVWGVLISAIGLFIAINR